MKSNSWVIVEIATGKAIAETFNETYIKHLKPAYKAIPAYGYLVELNRKIREGLRK